MVKSITDGVAPRVGLFSVQEQLLRRNVKRFRGRLVFNSYTFVALNSRLERCTDEEDV